MYSEYGVTPHLFHILFLAEHTGDKIARLGTEVSLHKNQILADVHQTPEYIYYIVTGQVVTFGYSDLGIEQYYACLSHGMLLFECSGILRTPLSMGFKAIRPTLLRQIPPDELIREIQSDRDSLRYFMKSITLKLGGDSGQVREGANKSVQWQVCNLLLNYASFCGVIYDDKVMIPERISQETMAKMLRVSRMSVIRALNELKQLNLVENINGLYCIRSEEKLQRHMSMIE